MTRAEAYIERKKRRILDDALEEDHITEEHAKTACEIAELEGRIKELKERFKTDRMAMSKRLDINQQINYLESQIKAKEEQ